MKRTGLLLLILGMVCPLSSQSGQCSVEEQSKVVIAGDNNGTIIQAISVDVSQINCYGNCYFFQDSALYILKDLSTQRQQSRRNVRPVAPLAKLSIAEEVVSQLPEEQQFCIKDFVSEQVRQDQYQVFQSDDENTVLIEVPVTENELVEYGLQVIYEPVEGISRVWELGEFYFLRGTECLTTADFGYGCERYGFATDFFAGVALVGQQHAESSYWFINTSGRRIGNTFPKIDLETFSDWGYYLFNDEHGQQILYSKAGQQLTEAYDEIKRFDPYLLVKKGAKYGLLFQDGTVFRAPMYTSVEKIGRGYLQAKQAENTDLLYGRSVIYSHPGVVNFLPTEKHIQIRNQEGKLGLFFLEDSRVIPCRYEGFQYFGEGYIKVKATEQTYQYIGYDGEPLTYEYQYMEDQPDDIGYVRIKNMGKYGYVDLATGGEVVPCEYDFISLFDPVGVAWIQKDSKNSSHTAGLLSRDGAVSLYPDVANLLRAGNYKPFNRYGIAFYRRFAINDYPFLGVMSYTDGPLVEPYWHADEPTKVEAFSAEIGLVSYYQSYSQRRYFLVQDGKRLTDDFFIVDTLFNSFLTIRNSNDYNAKYSLLKQDANWQTTFQEYDQLKSAYSTEFSGSQRPLVIGEKDNLFYLYDPNRPATDFLAGPFKSLPPFNYSVTYARCPEGGTAFVTTDGKQSDCYPFGVTKIVQTNWHLYAIIKKAGEGYGLYEILSGRTIIPPVLESLRYVDSTFDGTYQEQQFTIQDGKKVIPACLSGDCGAYQNALRDR